MKHTRYAWILDWMPEEAIVRRMFGCDAVYVDGKLKIVLADGDEPWNGLMICAEKDQHASLQKDFPIKPHPILGKWLYLPASHEDFEAYAEKVASMIRKKDVRIGTVSQKKRKAMEGNRLAKKSRTGTKKQQKKASSRVVRKARKR